MSATVDPTTLMHPEIVAAHRHFQQQMTAHAKPANPAEERRLVEEVRVWWNEGGPAIRAVEDASVPGPHRQIPVTIYRGTSSERAPVFVFLHGGAFRTGFPRANDRQMREIVDAWGGTIVSADYLHVPEHRFPVAVEEVAAVFRFLHDRGATWGLDGERIGFGGYSAGAPLGCGACLAVGGARAGSLRAGVAISGLMDFATDTASMDAFDNALPDIFPDRADVIQTVDNYAPTDAAKRDPRANPAYADPALLPPYLVCAAELDVLCDGSRNFVRRIANTGGRAELKVYKGMTHRFFGFSRMVEGARQCCADIAEFLSREMKA